MKDLVKKIFVFLPLVCLLVFVNYFDDPANIFSGFWYEKDMAEILLKGLNVANVSNYDERLLQKYYIEGLKHKIDIVVLGSSTAMQIRSEFFPNMGFFNNGVSGSCIEDYISIYEIYRDNNIKPKIIILGLDPWVLNKNNGQTRWGSIASYYDRFISRETLSRKGFMFNSLIDTERLFRLKRYLQLFSLSYFQSSARYLFHMTNKRDFNPKYYPTDLTESDVNIKLFDGSFSYRNADRLRPTSAVSKEAQGMVDRDSMYSMGTFYELDKGLIFKFERFIEILLNENIKIIFFLPPYHPIIYKYMINSYKYKIILEAESYFKRFALQNNIHVIGSYDPIISGCNETDFSDGRHVKTEATRRLFEKYRKYTGN